MQIAWTLRPHVMRETSPENRRKADGRCNALWNGKQHDRALDRQGTNRHSGLMPASGQPEHERYDPNSQAAQRTKDSREAEQRNKGTAGSTTKLWTGRAPTEDPQDRFRHAGSPSTRDSTQRSTPNTQAEQRTDETKVFARRRLISIAHHSFES